VTGYLSIYSVKF